MEKYSQATQRLNSIFSYLTLKDVTVFIDCVYILESWQFAQVPSFYTFEPFTIHKQLNPLKDGFQTGTHECLLRPETKTSRPDLEAIELLEEIINWCTNRTWP